MSLRKLLAGVLVCVLLVAATALTAPGATRDLAELVQELLARVEALEERVHRLEQELQAYEYQPVSLQPRAQLRPRQPFSFDKVSAWSVYDPSRRAEVGILLRGEVTNQSGRDYGTSAHFTLTLYDVEGRVIGSDTFRIAGLRHQQTKPFESGIVTGVDPRDIWEYRLDFDRGR